MTSRYDLDEAAYVTAFSAFQAAVAKAPGQTAFANMCRCTQGNISQLLRNGSLLPERFVLKAEAGTGIPRHHLRPDIYPSEPTLDAVADQTSDIACDRRAVSHQSARA